MGKSSLKNKISGVVGNLSRTMRSLLSLMVSVPRCGTVHASERDGRPLVIMGNGPSFRRDLDEDMELLMRSDTLAVNFAANSPEFRLLRPKYYVLADPHFFEKAETDCNVRWLIDSLNTVDWPMTLFVPVSARGSRSLFHSENLKVECFNFIAAEGFASFENFVFDRKWGMPRPRNVLIPSIMIGIWLGYRQIYLLGADHSWLKTLSVNDRNEVVSVQPHFYKEDEKESARIRQEYVRHPLHEVIESMMIAFRAYHTIQRYARRLGVEIFNATPDSMIDAFPRAQLPG